MTYDAIVIGAGPAGSTAALSLARRGWRVALLEKQVMPRDRLCGEFISPEGLSDLRRTGMDCKLTRFQPAEVRKAKITFPSGCRVSIEFDTPGWGLSRRILDAALFEEAASGGAECFQRSRVEVVQGSLRAGFEVTVRNEKRKSITTARTIIAATGRWSNLPGQPSSTTAGKFTGRRFLGLKAHYQGKIDLEEAVELHFFSRGYIGINRVEKGEINLCSLLAQDDAAPFARNWDDLLRAVALENKPFRERLERMHRCSDFIITSPVIFGMRKRVEKEVFIAGDAAGFLDPFSGDGISTAIRSGILASECVDGFLCGKNSGGESVGRYERLYNEEFKRRFLVSRIIRRAVDYPIITAAFSRLQKKVPGVGQWIVGQTRGRER